MEVACVLACGEVGDPADEPSMGAGDTVVGWVVVVPAGETTMGVAETLACGEVLDPADAPNLGVESALVGRVVSLSGVMPSPPTPAS
jgi:hypothetical protein